VQEPESALVPLMALSALKRTPADFVLPLNEMAALLQALANPETAADDGPRNR
jgi:hypothetical protein